jgi:hypothetical protein
VLRGLEASATALLVVLVVAAWLVCAPVPSASAAGLADDGGAQWRIEPILPPGVDGEQISSLPIGLGPVGDVEFWTPNRGLLITAGNGSTIPPGLWAYNGVHWHELSVVCGATDGRIAWAGPEEFWTVSDGRPGQAPDAEGRPAPLEDDTLCHFKSGAVVASYASPAFQASSYQPMQGAACLSALDCWFGGDALPEPQIGSFHLQWDGRTNTLEEMPYIGEGRPVEGMRAFDGDIYESVRISANAPVFEHLAEPPALHLINPLGVTPAFEAIHGLPLYSSGEFPEALEALDLSAEAESLWAAAGPRGETPEGSEPARVTVARYVPGRGWSQVLGPESAGPDPLAGKTVRSIAADPGTQAAWLALAPSGESGDNPTASAVVARVDAEGAVTDEQTLPSPQETAEGVGPKGAAAHITCPAAHECWLVTTQGWLFHLSGSPPGTPPPEGVDTDPAFAGVISYRPLDQGLRQQVPDAPPVELGLPEERSEQQVEAPPTPQPARESVALVSGVHLRLVHGTTLEMRFHLAVKARVRLIAKRKRSVVAATRTRTFGAGTRSLLLRLERRRWPTKLDLQSHALAKLPSVAAAGPSLERPFTTALVPAIHVSDDGHWELFG